MFLHDVKSNSSIIQASTKLSCSRKITLLSISLDSLELVFFVDTTENSLYDIEVATQLYTDIESVLALLVQADNQEKKEN